MLQRTGSDQRRAKAAAGVHAHDHDGHAHGHHHGDHQHHHAHDHAHHHEHDRAHAREALAGLDASDAGYRDAHERAHADDIRRRFANRNVTTGQIVLFGLTGGLIPCPAAITVLLLCLQLKQFSLGFALVLCFSIGLALTLVAIGAVAAFSVRHANRRWSGLAAFARNAPYLSSLLIIAVGLYVGAQGWIGLPA